MKVWCKLMLTLPQATSNAARRGIVTLASDAVIDKKVLRSCFAGRAIASRPGKTLNSAAGLPARVQNPVLPSATFRLLYELLSRVRSGFLVISPFRIACVFLHVERGRSSKRVWRSPRIVYLFIRARPTCHHMTVGFAAELRRKPAARPAGCAASRWRENRRLTSFFVGFLRFFFRFWRGTDRDVEAVLYKIF
jgi:hypothetical protein